MAEENVSVYIDILSESLLQKKQILTKIKEITEAQKEMLLLDAPDLTGFEEIMDSKEIYINKLLQIEEGFDSIYQRVEVELKENPVYYKPLSPIPLQQCSCQAIPGFLISWEYLSLLNYK